MFSAQERALARDKIARRARELGKPNPLLTPNERERDAELALDIVTERLANGEKPVRMWNGSTNRLAAIYR